MEQIMKDSGVEWIGEIPKSWEMERAKFNFSQSLERGNKTPELLAATQKYGMYPQRLLEGVVQVMAGTDLQQFKTVHKDDFVISLRSFQGGFERSDYEGVCSPAYQVFRSNERYDKNWLKWFFKSDMFIDAMNALTVGIREGRNIKYDDFANSILPIPPLSEQQSIASYLDEKCAAIDEIIAEAKATIDEYKSWKASVIFEAVTKGLNPNAEMKDSGVEWIGRIPKGWNIIKFKYLLSIKSGDAIRNEMLKDDGLYPVYGGGELIGYNDNYNVPNNTILIGRVGARCGCVTKILEKAWATDNALVLSDIQNLNYVYYLLIAADLNKLNLSNAQPLITATKIKNHFTAFVKDKNEQDKIVAYLDEKCAAIDGVIAEKEALIGELESYKKSLIFETVTGKRRVC